MSEERFADAASHLERVVDELGYEAVFEIEEAISELAYLNDPRAINVLLMLLRDDAPYEEVMYSFVHAAEAFNFDVFVEEVLLILPKLILIAPKWASILFMRMLNNERVKRIVINRLRDAESDVKASARWLCDEINKVDVAFLAKTTPVLLAAK